MRVVGENVRGLRARGFTLLELLVVIAIIGVLASLLLTAIRSVITRAAAARMHTQVQNLSVSLEAYHSDEGYYPGIAVAVDDDLALARALYRGLNNVADRSAGGGRSGPYYDAKLAEIGRAKNGAADATFGVAAPATPELVTADPLPPADGAQLHLLAYQTGAGAENVFIDTRGNYLHYREWESRTLAERTAGAARNGTRFDLWSNGLDGKNQSDDFHANVDGTPADGIDGQGDRIDDIGNFDY